MKYVAFSGTDDDNRRAIEKIAAKSTVLPTGCVVWDGGRASGYGRITFMGIQYQVHRLSYEAAVGKIPDGCHLDHLCRVKLCSNPQHLEPVTPRENVMRGIGPSAICAKKTHCPNGHPYDMDKKPWKSSNRPRGCRRCSSARTSAFARYGSDGERNGMPWSCDEDGRLVSMYQAGVPAKLMADNLGRSVCGLLSRVSALGIPKRKQV